MGDTIEGTFLPINAPLDVHFFLRLLITRGKIWQAVRVPIGTGRLRLTFLNKLLLPLREQPFGQVVSK